MVVSILFCHRARPGRLRLLRSWAVACPTVFGSVLVFVLGIGYPGNRSSGCAASPRGWQLQASDSVLAKEEPDSEANQAESGDVVSRTEKVVRRKDRHDQWGQATKNCKRNIIRERDSGEADRRWKRFHHDARNDTNYSNGQADERVERKQECGSRLGTSIEQIRRNPEADGSTDQYSWSAESIRQPAGQNTANRQRKNSKTTPTPS